MSLNNLSGFKVRNLMEKLKDQPMWKILLLSIVFIIILREILMFTLVNHIFGGINNFQDRFDQSFNKMDKDFQKSWDESAKQFNEMKASQEKMLDSMQSYIERSSAAMEKSMDTEKNFIAENKQSIQNKQRK